MEKMTEISTKQWDFITRENLTAREAVDFLKNGMKIRSFDDNMREISGTDAYEKRLVEGLYQIKAAEEVQLDSLKRKIRNWVNGKNMPSDREEVFQICFAMGFDLEQGEKLLTRLTEQGIHYRNPREIIYAYCLKYHVSYVSAALMAEQFLDKDKKAGKECDTPVTQMIKEEFQKVRGEEDLFAFVMKHRIQMGDGHNTAYAYFTKMLDVLSDGVMEDEERFSMEEVVETFLRLNVPLDKKTAGYSNVQKIIKKYWPGARSIKAMKSRSEDVNRKTLLLLYIANSGALDDKYAEVDEDYLDAEAFLELHCKRMNKMLYESGMSRIDPRNMFDYLVLYCLRPEDEIFMSDRMQSLMEELF